MKTFQTTKTEFTTNRCTQKGLLKQLILEKKNDPEGTWINKWVNI